MNRFKIGLFFITILFIESYAMNQETNKTIFYPTQAYIAEIQQVWSQFLNTHNWQELIKGVSVRNSNCGLVYELPNYLNRANEGLAIVDMRGIKYTEPHYHPDPMVEFYFILQGNALIISGTDEIKAGPGCAIVNIYGITHYVIPDSECVMAVINTPPFTQNDYIKISETDPIRQFDRKQFNRLTGQYR